MVDCVVGAVRNNDVAIGGDGYAGWRTKSGDDGYLIVAIQRAALIGNEDYAAILTVGDVQAASRIDRHARRLIEAGAQRHRGAVGGKGKLDDSVGGSVGHVDVAIAVNRQAGRAAEASRCIGGQNHLRACGG